MGGGRESDRLGSNLPGVRIFLAFPPSLQHFELGEVRRYSSIDSSHIGEGFCRSYLVPPRPPPSLRGNHVGTV